MCGTTSDGAIVATLAVKEEPEALGVSGLGEMSQVAWLGAPEQASVTVPLKPLTAVTCRL